jgi:hypothetical protein
VPEGKAGRCLLLILGGILADVRHERRAAGARGEERRDRPKDAAAAPASAPNLTALYRDKVARLHEEPEPEELPAEAAEAIRCLIDEVRLVGKRAAQRSSSRSISPLLALA